MYSTYGRQSILSCLWIVKVTLDCQGYSDKGVIEYTWLTIHPWLIGDCQSNSDCQRYFDQGLKEYAWLTIHGCLGIIIVTLTVRDATIAISCDSLGISMDCQSYFGPFRQTMNCDAYTGYAWSTTYRNSEKFVVKYFYGWLNPQNL